MWLVWAWGKIVKVFFKSWKKLCCSKLNSQNISCSEKEIIDEKEINTELFKFYKVLFELKINVSNALIQGYLNVIEIPKLCREQSQRCKGVITEEELLKALKKMPNNKLPENNRITKKFSEAFWDDLKTPVLLSVNKTL